MASKEQFYASLRQQLREIDEAGLSKVERVINSRQGNRVSIKGGKEVINLCANNYLGLSSHPDVIAAAHQALDARGFGLSSVRFICGTQDIHRDLEERLARFLGTEDVILYGSAFDANGGLFETLLGPEDAIVSDELNHASIIDGIRLSKARRYRYSHDDMEDLRRKLGQAASEGARRTLVFTDGVFSMDGTVAQLDRIRDLCDEFGALLGIDDSHATGFVGETGRGTHEFREVYGQVDIITGTLGKALGGASGGFTAARREVVAMLRQRSRPYLFSNTVSPVIVGATLKVLDLLEADTRLRDTLERNTRYFRTEIVKAGFEVKTGTHPIVPVMMHDAGRAQAFARRLLELGIYVTAFSYPVVPKALARIRVQLSALHTADNLTFALAAFRQAGMELKII